ncbi:nitroreductase [Bifidobacterium sp. SMB2]|uniref:Nitroreductase n=1 Tax=Bifidobacterium saimiriisciurei TaxID=2661627 RepID=A0ABX0C621_9BIFI|nr:MULTISPECIES: nitroreductase family protein [Bifidobacterium]NEG96499.1 nitroreductase [Bifidobacterium sp. SMB2]NEH10584.1 nitroreductase [Bifidobacterium saimiriisciurei]NEH10633.1 nitroreductase [Bifidobacterium saimiriisciurei]
MEFNDVIARRYACRKYDARQVAQSDLDAILEAGRLAPTSVDQQEQHVYVIRSAEGLAKVDELSECRYGAPTVLMVTYDMTDVFEYPGGRYDSGVEDASIATTQMMLAATDCGVGSCWVNVFDPDKVREAFGLADKERVVAMLDLGYPAVDAEPSAKHARRKPIDKLVTYL